MPWLARPGIFVALARRALNAFISYEKTVALAESMRDAEWHEIMAALAKIIARRVTAAGLHHIPAEGPAFIVANHPTGIADGIILHSLLAKTRPDAFFFARGDVLNVLPQMRNYIAPVEWRPDQQSFGKMRGLMTFVKTAIDAGRLGVIFPAGRTGGLVYQNGLTVLEPQWIGSAAMLARKFSTPVIPVHITAWNSPLFYLFDFIHPTLGDIALFHETLNKGRQRYRVVVGEPIAPSAFPADSGSAIELLRRACMSL